jgi:c-di-GMP-binding flagellar brake protein YcgR
MLPELVVGQTLGVTFRRAHRKCVFETTVTGRCNYSTGRADDVPALRLEWPESVFEMQRRLYYRTPVPRDAELPVQVRVRDEDGDCETDVMVCRGRMGDVSAGGMSVVLKNAENPRWRPETRVECKFVGASDGPAVELYGHMRYLYEMPEGGVRMGVQFVGLETDGAARSTLDEIIELTKKFQEIERRRGD